MEDKTMERFQCVYYNYIAQSYEIIEIAAKNRKEALMVAYLATGKRYEFEDLEVHYASDRYIRTMDDYDKPNQDDIDKWNAYWEENYGDDDDD